MMAEAVKKAPATPAEKAAGRRGIAVTFLTLFPALAWHGYVTMCIWNWFAVPILHAPVLTIWKAVGLLETAWILLPAASAFDAIFKTIDDDPDYSSPAVKAMTKRLTAGALFLFALGIAWFVRWLAF